MTFRQRILLDRLLAVPLSVAVNIFVRLLGVILRRDHSINSAATRCIVVCKLVGMGSILQATPLLRALKQRFPQARTVLVTLAGNRSLVERLEAVDEAVYLDDRGAMRMMWTTLRVVVHLIWLRVDHYFDLELYSGFACLLAASSMARNRLGFYRQSNQFKKGIYTHLVYFNTRMPVRRTYLQLGRVAGVPADVDDGLGTIRIAPAERDSLQAKLVAAGLAPGSPYILINPNASDLLLERRWSESYVIETVTRLARLDHNIVFMGAKPEAAFVQSLCDRVPAAERPRVFNTAGQFTLGEALALIESAACVVTNDTGPMHMAFILAQRTVCLVGPADPAHYGIKKPGVVTLYAPVSCSPCIYETDEPPCNGNNVCMQRLMPELVVTQVLQLLTADTAEPEPAGGTIRLPLVWETEAGCPLGIVVRSSNVEETP